jgi:hypothetical protein
MRFLVPRNDNLKENARRNSGIFLFYEINLKSLDLIRDIEFKRDIYK